MKTKFDKISALRRKKAILALTSIGLVLLTLLVVFL